MKTALALSICAAALIASDPARAQELPIAGTPLTRPGKGAVPVPAPGSREDMSLRTQIFVNDAVSVDPTGRKVTYQDVIDPGSEFFKRTATFVPRDPEEKIIYNAARGIGIRAGYADEASRINTALQQRYAGYLSSLFDFRRWMIQQYVLPPVITEITDVKEGQGGDLLFFSNSAFEIVKEARLTTNPPKWQEYLFLSEQAPAAPQGISVETDKERQVWAEGARNGWFAGIMEARRSFVNGWNILNRDYGGMKRYHELSRQGVVSLPGLDTVVRQWRVADEGKRAFRGEKTIRLQVAPRFRARR